MKINLLDPALSNDGGHHYDWDTRIANLMAEQGHEVRVYASKTATGAAVAGFRPDVEVAKIFRMKPYLEPASFDPICGEIERQLIGRQVLAEDLKKVAEADLWVWPTLFSYQLLACAMVRPRAAISACLLYPPADAAEFAHAEPAGWWRFAAKAAVHAKLDIRSIGAPEPEALTSFLPLVGDLDPIALPVPVDANPRRRVALETVGFFGAHPRMEHGSLLVAPLVERCLGAGLKVVIQDGSILSEQAKRHPNIAVLGHEDDFDAKVSMADLVVMPYEWHKYLGRGSGIAYQAMASGVPCVAPRGATFTRSLQRIGSASLFGSLTEGAIFAAILAARQNFAALAEAAYAGALDWRREHGLAKFVDAMIGVSHGAAARASRR